MPIAVINLALSRRWVSQTDELAIIWHDGTRFIMSYGGVAIYQTGLEDECTCPTGENVTWTSIDDETDDPAPSVTEGDCD